MGRRKESSFSQSLKFENIFPEKENDILKKTYAPLPVAKNERGKDNPLYPPNYCATTYRNAEDSHQENRRYLIHIIDCSAI